MALARELLLLGFDGPPVEIGMQVGVGVYLDNILEVNTFQRSFTATARTVERWLDPRNYSRLFQDENGQRSWVSLADLSADCRERVTTNSSVLSGRFVDLPAVDASVFWTPDLTMRNIRDPKFNEVISSTLRVFEGGTVERVRSWNIQLYLSSPYFGAYPFDVQALTIELQSTTLTADRLSLTTIDALCGYQRLNTHSWPGWQVSGKPVVPGRPSGQPAIWAAGTGLNPRWPETQRAKNILYPQAEECSRDVDARSAFVFSLAVKRKHEKVLGGAPCRFTAVIL